MRTKHTCRGEGYMDLRDPATQELLEQIKQEALKRILDEHRGQASLHLEEGEVLAW